MENKPLNRKVEIAAMLDHESLRYRVEMSPAEAVSFFTVRGDQQGVDLCTEITAAIPPMRYEVGNGNNGKPHHKFLIGREYSRVIYLSVVAAYLKGDEMLQIGKAMASLSTKYGTDEFSRESDSGSSQWRLWWD